MNSYAKCPAVHVCACVCESQLDILMEKFIEGIAEPGRWPIHWIYSI